MNLTCFLFAIIGMFTTPGLAVTDSPAVTITFKNVIGNEQLQLGKTYQNAFNEPFTVTRFKYYVSGIAFLKADGTRVEAPSYFLINEEDGASKTLTIPLKAGAYKSISFLIGVDSIKNVSGTQTDALDPMNGMFWTWNSGYIMAKLEATSPLAKSPGKIVEYHIGGFRYNQNTVRSVTLSFPVGGLNVGNEDRPGITIEADVNKWFSGEHDLKIADHNVCTTPGDLAIQYADNYARMFAISSVNIDGK